MTIKTTLTLLTSLVFLLFLGCGKNENDKPAGKWSKSVFIINEGPFPTGSGTISAFNRETLEVSHNLFEAANGRPLGNIVQSLTVHNNKAFIVVNNANKIEIVDLEDFKSVATIENLGLPRYFIGFDEDKGYVSCWDESVKVINLVDYSVMASVQTGAGPDEMLMSGDRLFVINSGGFGVDSTVSVISTSDEESLGRIIVGLRPSGIKKDVNGNIWVLCSGKGWNGFPDPGDTPARLVCLDPVSLTILKEISFPDSHNHPDNLIIDENGSTLYYNHPQGIFSFPVSAASLNSQPLIPGGSMYFGSMFYGLGYDEILKMIYVTDPLDYAQNGWVFRYHATDGTPLDSLMVGIIPNGFLFNN